MKISFEKSARLQFHVGFILFYLALFSFWLSYRFPALLDMPCPIKTHLSIPCITCGSSRSIAALFNFDFISAFTANPLLVFILLILFMIIFSAVLQLIAGKRLTLMKTKAERHFLHISFLLLIAVNYIWLIYN